MLLRNHLFFTLLILSFCFYSANAQTDEKSEDDLLSLLETDQPEKIAVTSTFASTRIANGHSSEMLQPGILDFRVSHRFGYLNQGIQDFFGLDNAQTRIGFDFGVMPWLMVGVGRSSYLKEYDGFVKLQLLQQMQAGGSPVTVEYLGAASVEAYPKPAYLPDTTDFPFLNRMAYVNQILIARKINSWLSLQLMPTHIHYNMVDHRKDKNNVLALGFGGRAKLSRRLALTWEYFYVLPGNKLHDPANAEKSTTNPLTIGLDVETGGHVFQIFFSNATGISERQFVGKTTGEWLNGDVHFGFNISRIFTVVKPKDFKDSRNRIW